MEDILVKERTQITNIHLPQVVEMKELINDNKCISAHHNSRLY